MSRKVCVVVMVLLLVIGIIGVVKSESHDWRLDMVGKLMVRLYVFNDATQAWDRAREETVKGITCDKLRGVGLPTNEEYLIDKGVGK